MKAIVYKSETGFTKKYADMLGKQTGLAVVELSEAKKKLKKSDEIVYLGWIMAGKIVGLKKASRRFKVKAVGAVGMTLKEDKYTEFLTNSNRLKTPLFYMQGGLDASKLKGLKAFGIKLLAAVFRKVHKNKELTEDDKIFLEMFEKRTDLTSEDNLAELTEWCKIYKK